MTNEIILIYMAFPVAFKYNSNVDYQIGCKFETSHEFSLVHQKITIKQNKSFDVHFPNIWQSYKLPLVKEPEIYDTWISNPMQFWQNQLNFAVWCATSGCGVSKLDHLKHKDPMVRSVFRFHVYYQIRRILNEMQCPLPNDDLFNALNNPFDKTNFEKICTEFGISSKSDFRQKLDYSEGLGTVRYYSLHGLKSKPTKVFEKGRDYDPSQKWTVFIPASGKFGAHDQHRYKIEYIEQYFSKDKIGSQFDAIGSFVLDKSVGFTQAGISRINDSIRTFVWAILGAQAQTRSSILSEGKAFDAQKQFLANVEDAINSAVDIPSSINRYQSTLQYARSKVDFVLGLGLYMIPSDMDLFIGTINGYNNLIVIASPDEIKQIGQNNINDEPVIPQETFESPPDDFDTFEETEQIDQPPEQTQDEQIREKKLQTSTVQTQELSHDERKLLITLCGVIGGSFLIWFAK